MTIIFVIYMNITIGIIFIMFILHELILKNFDPEH